ncbi:hypothetical protein GCM10025875_33120 [Litorihabitans aurantiacus]|uniref:Radical SAM core domain-containing protein n=1 Tax=Litorihabitans aurantiacus TaxID=1930061 RepID=A0AA37XIR8_9MICO|nr:hypothetical protein GCM10025875_33120 [Litorihabitans aurantiacus]
MTGVPVTIGRRPPRWEGVVPGAAPSGAGGPGDPLVDTWGRVHRDLRISLTDRCSLRCTYCMPEQGMEWLARSSVLTTDEIVRVARICADAGITTFRLTGESRCCGATCPRSWSGWRRCGGRTAHRCRSR